jgi:CheY-like chemotaxis protein
MTNRVLFVDDEALILNSLRRGLMGEEYEMSFANNGEEALKILGTEEFSVLVTDMKMPGMSGLDLLKETKKLYPHMVKIVLSGYTQLPQVLVTVNQGDIFRFITKPWDLENEFKWVIREAVDYYNYRIELIKGREALEKKNVSFQNILKSYDDKILSVKDEVALMRDLNMMIYKEQNKLLKHWDEKLERRDSLLEKMMTLETMVLEVFNMIPFAVKRFSPKNIIDEIKRSSAERRCLKRYDFGLDSKAIGSLKGKFDLLLFMIMKISDLLFVEAFETLINVVISSEAQDEDSVWIRVVLQVAVTSIQTGTVQDVVLSFLQEMGKRQGVTLQVITVNEDRAIMIKMLFSK